MNLYCTHHRDKCGAAPFFRDCYLTGPEEKDSDGARFTQFVYANPATSRMHLLTSMRTRIERDNAATPSNKEEALLELQQCILRLDRYQHCAERYHAEMQTTIPNNETLENWKPSHAAASSTEETENKRVVDIVSQMPQLNIREAMKGISEERRNPPKVGNRPAEGPQIIQPSVYKDKRGDKVENV